MPRKPSTLSDRSKPQRKHSKSQPSGTARLKVKVIIHEAEEGGFWAEVPALPGCFTEGESREELLANLRDAIEGVLLGPQLAALGHDAHAEEIEL